MRRHQALLPDFTRFVWVSNNAKNVWSPRLGRIAAMSAKAELLSVAEGIRPATIQIVRPEELPQFAQRVRRSGVTFSPVGCVGRATSHYANTNAPATAGEPVDLVVAIARPQHLDRIVDAYWASDSRAIGECLGYPPCCVEFFAKWWVAQGFVDTTWPMAVRTVGSTSLDIDTTGAWQCNILWRWVAIRAVPHLPCSFTCAATVRLANDLLDCTAKEHSEEHVWLKEVLSWPVEWSCLHGIAEVLNPIMKIVSRSDAAAERTVVRLRGTAYPNEGANGIKFPYRSAAQRRLPLAT